MQRHRAQTAAFRHARQFHANDFIVVPSRAKFHRERYLHRRAHRFKDLPDQRQIAEQARSTITLHDLLGRAAQIQVHQVEAQVFHQPGSVGKHPGAAPEKLGRHRMLVFVEVKVTSPYPLVAQ